MASTAAQGCLLKRNLPRETACQEEEEEEKEEEALLRLEELPGRLDFGAVEH